MSIDYLVVAMTQAGALLNETIVAPAPLTAGDLPDLRAMLALRVGQPEGTVVLLNIIRLEAS